MIDPWRTLGLAPGATLDEVRRAYRRLAKAYHPDSAGEAALPRFLAIQTAYEMLVPDRRTPVRPLRRAPRPAWQAEPERARATRDETRSRSRPRGTRPSDEPTDGSRPPSGAADGTRPSDDTASARTRAGSGSSRPGSSGKRRRGSNRATPGSTTYGRASEEAGDSAWAGATWYGASSGEYWRVNPREYADPRKHGPEYLRRAARPTPNGGDHAGADHAGGDHVNGDHVNGDHVDGGGTGPADRHGDPGDAGADISGADAWTSTGWSSETFAGDASTRRTPPPPPPPRTGPLPGEELAGRILGLLRNPSGAGLGGRLLLAAIAWPPLGAALGVVLGELTGCARFSATCDAPAPALIWLVQLALGGLLVALPGLAAIGVYGTAGMLAVAVPATMFLSISGGTRLPGPSAAALAVCLVAGWCIGIGVALVGRLRGRTRPPTATSQPGSAP
jgi:hypothetical protein